MPEKPNALSVLAAGDELIRRAEREGRPVKQIATADGLGQPGGKAAWLSRSYAPDAREALGDEVLRQLSAGHLEAVAALPEGIRGDLLRQAVDEQLPVRQLRTVAAAARSVPNPAQSSTIAELGRAARAMKTYSGLDDAALRRLTDGPNGTAVRTAAAAGQELSARLAACVN
jgi:hypothetical protein